MRISVVIPALEPARLAPTLRALDAQSRLPDEVLVIGPGAAGPPPPTRVPSRFVDTGAAVCAAGARNRGIAECSGQVVAFLDSDCEPRSDWLEVHERCQRSGERVVGGAVELAGDNYWAQSDNVSLLHPFLTTRRAGYRFVLPTLNLSVHRKVIEAVGLLDESFPGAAAEDSDWAIRMRHAGFRLRFEPQAVVRHRPSRNTWTDIAHHWERLGASSLRVRLRYPEEFGTPGFLRQPALLLALAPLIALKTTAGIHLRPTVWRYAHCLPVVFLSKLAFLRGAVRSLRSGYAFRPSGGTDLVAPSGPDSAGPG